MFENLVQAPVVIRDGRVEADLRAANEKDVEIVPRYAGLLAIHEET